MASARQLARAQHSLNLATLDSLDGRRSTLHAALAAARSALQHAQADIDALEPELATIDKMRDVLIPEIQRQRGIFSRALLDTFPPELLRAIFLELVAGPDLEWPESNAHDGAYNPVRNAVPFKISAVCSRWRAIAMNVGALWAYIAVPRLVAGLHTTHSTYLMRVKALLERSKQHSLDVMLDWGHHKDATVASWHDCQHYRLIFDAVGLHAKRWRRVQVAPPQGVAVEHLAWLCERTPLLEDFTIVRSSPTDTTLSRSDHLPRLLPYCPLLKRLCSVKIFLAPDHALPLLSELHVEVDEALLDPLWSLLRNTQSLRTLIIQLPSDPIDAAEPPNPALCLRALTDLGVYGDIRILPPIFASISMPALSCLQIYSDSAQDIHLFRDTAVQQISKLVVGQADGPALDGEMALLLSALEHVRELALSYCENVLPAFFNGLVAEGGLWPKLEAVAIDGGSLDDDAAGAFLLFIQSRQNAREAEGLSPFRLNLKAVVTPAWLTAHIRARFGDAAVQSGMSSDTQSRPI